MIESILLSATPVAMLEGRQLRTHASGFFFERDDRLFLVTSRHVMIDEPSHHAPDRLEIELHTDAENIAATVGFSIPLYRGGKAAWRQGMDSAGGIDVAVIEIDRSALPESVVLSSFGPQHLLAADDVVEVGTPALILGFPLGFHDRLHHVPVVRHAVEIRGQILAQCGVSGFSGHADYLSLTVQLSCTDVKSCCSLLYGSLAASATGFQWSLPARKTLGMYCAARCAVSWCDQGTRAAGLAPGP